MPIDQINEHAKSYKEDATNVNNDMSLGQMLSIQKKQSKWASINKPFAQIQIPALGLTLPIFKGANQYIESCVGYLFYEDAEMRKGNYVLAGHNIWKFQVFYFSDIQKSCH